MTGRTTKRRGMAGAALLWMLYSALGSAQPAVDVLRPPDRSSPRATLTTFLQSADAVASLVASEYAPDPTRAKFDRLIELGGDAVNSLDLSGLPPAARLKGSRAATLSLYEVLSRINLPPLDQVPDAAHLPAASATGTIRWLIPNTEIELTRLSTGPHAGEFVFSADTVARAEVFYDRVHELPYTRPVPVQGLKELVVGGGGWMVPNSWVRALPPWLRTPLADQAVWKWLAFSIVLAAYGAFLVLATRLSRLPMIDKPFVGALMRLVLPVAVLLGTPVVAYLALVQVNLIDEVAIAVAVVTTVVLYLAGAWISWRLAPVIAEAMIASPDISAEGVDAHLIRVTTRLFAIFASGSLLALGADRLGVPVYGIVAGLGVGGLAIALAAQPTIENLIGGLNLFADRPIRVGDVCKYDGAVGTVEAIGMRSTRLRGPDRTITTVPNGALAKMSIINLTRRDQILLQTTIGLRYETTAEQLRYVLVKVRELLLGHPRVDPSSARTRLVGFNTNSLDAEIFAYVTTNDWAEFLGIREDIFLRVMTLVEECGTGFAFPSQTVYMAYASGPDDHRVKEVEAKVQLWRDEGTLPFPNFSPEQISRFRDTVVFPPPGSASPL